MYKQLVQAHVGPSPGTRQAVKRKKKKKSLVGNTGKEKRDTWSLELRNVGSSPSPDTILQ